VSQPHVPQDAVITETEEKASQRVRRLPPFHVILVNDDHHSQEFVVDVLCTALGFRPEKAYHVMIEAHTRGKSVVWTGPKEVAELKAEQIQTFHETRGGAKLGPLGVVLEPAPE
jgi:ATP-dependent Clp protease adaptor protein ClpS